MDYSQYHPDWKDIIRPSILQRDNYSCQHCRIRHKSIVYKKSNGEYHVCDEFEHEWAKANNKNPFTLFLHVAHLNHDKTDNRPENLLALCPRCHGKYDREFKKFTRKVYKNKAYRPSFKNDFNLKMTPDQVKAYLESRYSWVVKEAPTVPELKNLIRFILKIQ